MSGINQIAKINKSLEPYLFQVIGSTPASIRDAIKQMNLKGNSDSGAELMMACLFAAAVNKQVLEQFLIKADMGAARNVVNSTMSINGRPNMTGMTLFGHALLTTSAIDGVKFAAEFRRKMGQRHIWDGSFATGSLGDKQKGILLEKARVHNLDEAKLLGNGFLKYTKIIGEAMTRDEATWWSETYASHSPQKSLTRTESPSRPSSSGTQSQQKSTPSKMRLQLGQSQTVAVRDDIARYYMINHTEEQLRGKVRELGVEKFEQMYGEAMIKDPSGKAAGSLIGR